MNVVKYGVWVIVISAPAHVQAMHTSAANIFTSLCSGLRFPAVPAVLAGVRAYHKQSDAQPSKNMQAAVTQLARDLTHLRRYNNFYRGCSPEQELAGCTQGMLNLEDFANYLAKVNTAYAAVCEEIKGQYKSDHRAFIKKLNKQLQQIHVTRKHVVEELNLASSILEHYRLVHGQNILAAEIEVVKHNQSRIVYELERLQEKLNAPIAPSSPSFHVVPPLAPELENLIQRTMANIKNNTPRGGGR